MDLATPTVQTDLSSFTSDADDEHICALALAGEATLLLTFDHGYERAALAAHGVEVAEPDAFLSGLLDEQPSAALAVIETQAYFVVLGVGIRSNLGPILGNDRSGPAVWGREPTSR